MPDPNREVEELGARLSEIDRELGEIQAELLPPGDARGPTPEELTVSAGPFHTVEEVRAFERELARLPGVRAAVLRGYEGSDRAVIDVQLER